MPLNSDRSLKPVFLVSAATVNCAVTRSDCVCHFQRRNLDSHVRNRIPVPLTSDRKSSPIALISRRLARVPTVLVQFQVWIAKNIRILGNSCHSHCSLSRMSQAEANLTFTFRTVGKETLFFPTSWFLLVHVKKIIVVLTAIALQELSPYVICFDVIRPLLACRTCAHLTPLTAEKCTVVLLSRFGCNGTNLPFTCRPAVA